MDKRLLTIILFLICAVLFLFAWKVLLPKSKKVYDQTNRIFIVKGDVKIKKAGEGAQWQQMEVSTILEKGDMLETAAGSMVDVIIGPDTEKMVKLDENSRLEVQEINPAYLHLSRGKLFVALKKLEPKSSFKVKTPTAICGAQGTAWSESATGDSTRICVFENNVIARGLYDDGRALPRMYTINEGFQRNIFKGGAASDPGAIGADDMDDWKYWSKNVEFLREGKILVNDFNRKENFNNLRGQFGSWVVFFSDANQYCRDEFTAVEKIGETGQGLKLSYDVDSPFSAYNGFFTNLMGIDLTSYKYLVFHIKGDSAAGFTTRINVELKNKFQAGKLEVKGITDEWEKIVLPLEKFAGLTTLQNMKELVMVFSDLNATKKEGVVYIDDLYFSMNDESDAL